MNNIATGLTYTETNRTCTETQIEREFTIPTSWGMFTAAGNRSMTKKAETVVKKVKAANRHEQKVNAFAAYFRSYNRTCHSATMDEAMDTDVRERVWDFACRLAKAVKVDHETLDKLWNENC